MVMKSRRRIALVAILIMVLCSSLGRSQSSTMTLSSSAFQNGSNIPQRFTCQGDNISPALSWTGAPQNTKSFALTLLDPDAPGGTFTHWVIWKIPFAENSLQENILPEDSLPNGMRQGVNSAGIVGYFGPCPPPGGPHHYHFMLYALDAELNLSGNVTSTILLSAMRNHILAQGELIGLYPSSSSNVAQPASNPEGVKLDIYPNPCNSETKLTFRTSNSIHARLYITNTLGQLVTTLFDGAADAGDHNFTFDASKLASSTYYCNLETQTGTARRVITIAH